MYDECGSDKMITNYKKSILNLTNSIMKHYKAKVNHSSLPTLDEYLKEDKDNIILLIMDGMGNDYLEKFHPDGFLLKHRKDIITSVFPCTTTAAIRTYESGLSPLEHGNLGWTLYFKETNKFINILPYRDDDTLIKISEDDFDYCKLMSYKSILDYIDENSPDVKKHLIYPNFIVNTHENSMYHGYLDFPHLCEIISTIAHQEGKKFIYIYCDNPDALMHEHGPSSYVVHKYMEMVQDNLEKLIINLKDTSYTLIISADHGQIDVDEYIPIYQDETLMEMLEVRPFIEARCCSFHVKEEYKNKFAKYFNEKYGKYYVLLTKEEFINQGYLGKGKKHPKIDDFIRDFVGIATTYHTFSIKESSFIMKGQHAGLCKEENEVPLIII